MNETGFHLSYAADTGTLAINGVLDFDTAAAALEGIRAAVVDPSIRQIDLARVQRSDSAGLSCILAVKAEVVASGHTLQIINMPAGMRALAQVCEVEQLIG